jgi:hypothetical protein
VVADTITTFLDATGGTPVTDTTTATLANSEVMRIGRLSGAGTSYGEFSFLGAAVFKGEALSAADLALVKQELLN